MIEAETVLLSAVASHLKTEMSLSDSQCSVEIDEQNVPAIAGDRYLTVIPAGINKGPRHDKSGGVIDLFVAVKVCVYHRMADVPRDRRRNVFLERTKGLNAELTNVMDAVDYRYEVTNAANTEIAVLGNGEGFIKPLQFQSIDSRPQAVMRDPYDATPASAKGDPIVAIRRGVTFGLARFLMVRRPLT